VLRKSHNSRLRGDSPVPARVLLEKQAIGDVFPKLATFFGWFSDVRSFNNATNVLCLDDISNGVNFGALEIS